MGPLSECTSASNTEPNANEGTGMYNRVRNYASLATNGQGAGRTGARNWRNGSSAGDLNTTDYLQVRTRS